MSGALADLIAPTFHTTPERDFTDGDLVADLLASCSDDKGPFILDPEQRMVLDDWFGYLRTPDGPKLASFEGADIACRQNQKTGVLKAAALGKIFISEQRLVVWSSHEFFAAREAFRDLRILIESNPELEREVLHVWTGAGSEAIEFTGDRRLIFKARTGTSARSLSGDTVILDEAFALQPEHIASLAATLAARPDPQMLYGSSAGLLSSTVLRALRDRGRLGAPRLSYAEWMAEKRPCADPDCDHAVSASGCALDDPDLWREANTAVARGRMTIDTLAGLRQANAADPMKFGREHLGWWDDPGDLAGSRPIDADTWSELASRKSSIVGECVFALDVAPRRAWSGIVAAGTASDGRVHVEVPSRRGECAYWRGTSEIIPTFKRLRKRFEGATVRILAKSQAAPYAPKLIELGYEVDLVSPADYLQMCSALADAVADGVIAHLGDDTLTSAVHAGVAVDVGEEQWRWGRHKSGGDIVPLVAMTLAVDGVRNGEGGSGVGVW